MADKRIQDLTPATSVGTSDQFVLQQSGQAKSLTGQILINDLAAALDGHGGISNVSYTPPVSPSLVGTLTITLADGTSYDVSLTNGADGADGVGISSITDTTSGTQGDGMTHTITVEMSDGTEYEFTLHDGMKGDTGAADNLYFMWADNFPDSDADMYDDNTGPWIGIAHSPSTAPEHYTDYQWYEWQGPQGVAGSSIASIALTSQTGLVDTYTITLTDGNTNTFNVTNAKSIASITMVSGSHAAGTTDTYEILFNDGDTASFSVYNGANGLGSVSTVSGIQSDGNGDVPQVISGNGAPTTATVGQANQLYYDLTNSVMYYCAGESGGTYVWLGAGVTVDSALSGSSTNPVQNKVITGRVGTGALPNSNTNLTDAVNYVNGIIPAAASQTPLADTTNGAVGTGTNFARNDHKHPLNVATSGTPSALGTASNGSSAYYARQDHVHALPSIPSAASSAPSSDTSGGATGTSEDYARADHRHKLNLDLTAPANLAATASAGSSNVYARRDHVHKFPTAANVGAVSNSVTTGTLTKNFSPAFTSNGSYVKSDGHLGILNLDLRYSTGFTAETWTNLFTSSVKPKSDLQVSGDFSGQSYTISFNTSGTVQIFAHGQKYTYFVRMAIPFFIV